MCVCVCECVYVAMGGVCVFVCVVVVVVVCLCVFVCVCVWWWWWCVCVKGVGGWSGYVTFLNSTNFVLSVVIAFKKITQLYKRTTWPCFLFFSVRRSYPRQLVLLYT